MDLFGVLWGQITFKDLMDIVLVALLIYQALLIIHGTRAVQMLVGMAFLIVMYAVSHRYKLYSLKWLLDNFFNSFFIIAVILFQDQIRSALANFGRQRNFFGLINQKNEGMDIEEIIEVCGAMSREKVGALIVFERQNGLLNYINTGTVLGAEVHSDLIYAIFQSSSPLHDGAIIIADGKLTAAGCFLPLARDIEIDRHLGTRHRAAMGVTQDTDAIAVTVSEETGKINVCFEGRFYFCESTRHLRQYLKHLWSNEKLDEALKPIEADKGGG